MKKLIAAGAMALVTAVVAACGAPSPPAAVTAKVVTVEVIKTVTVEVPVEVIKTVTVEVPVEVIKTVTVEVTPEPEGFTKVPEGSTPEECLEQGQTYLNEITGRVNSFQILRDIASSTPRISLPTVLAQLGQQRSSLFELRPEQGCVGVYVLVDSWMELIIQGLGAFAAQQPDYLVQGALNDAEAKWFSVKVNLDIAREKAGMPLAFPAGPREPTPEPSSTRPSNPLTLTDVSYRVGERNSTWWKFSYQFTLVNSSSRPIEADFEIKFLDSDGFVVDDHSAYNVVVPAGGTKTYSDSTLIDTGEASRVVSVQVEGG